MLRNNFDSKFWIVLVAGALTSALCTALVNNRLGTSFFRRAVSFTSHITPTHDRSSLSTFISTSKLSRDTDRLADTTAVVLNWSRLPNVILIVSSLCKPLLSDTIAEVVVWNNSPQKLSQRDFSNARCPPGKLRIHNSPENLYFQARFIACAEASTPHCFIQDDDYLIYPEIIRTLRARIAHPKREGLSGIHLLPAHEHLSSSLRVVSDSSQLHTSFAWLGHGAMLFRSQAQEFLDLMRHLNASDAELKMADNFYTIMSNTVSETWFDQGVELGGGEAFTVGQEGHERNRRFIMKAGEYLDSAIKDATSKLPFINSMARLETRRVARTPCISSSCLLETNISLLPSTIRHSAESAMDMLSLEEANVKILGSERQSHYLLYPPSNILDGRTDSAFRSPEVAHIGDMISLDMLSSIPAQWSNIEMMWLIDVATEAILQASLFEASTDGIDWMHNNRSLRCWDTDIANLCPTQNAPHTFLRECAVSFSLDVHPRVFRVRLKEERDERWCIYEMWIRETK